MSFGVCRVSFVILVCLLVLSEFCVVCYLIVVFLLLWFM